MGQYPPSGPRRPIGDDEDDDEVANRSQYGDQGRGGGDRQFTYYQEERYWTDYLRIAAPVLGVILLLGLAWFWINNLIGDDGADPTPTSTTGSGGIVITGGSPTARSGLGTPLAVATNNPGGGATSGTPGTGTGTATGKFKNGDKVKIANTGGSGANMRSQPTTAGEIVTTLADGAALTITGESQKADGYTWWPVEGADGKGFVVEDFIQLQ